MRGSMWNFYSYKKALTVMLVDFDLEEEERKKKTPHFRQKLSLATYLHYFNYCVSRIYLNLLLINGEL